MINYLYLDDEESESYANAISERNDDLHVTHAFPKLFGEQIKDLATGEYDGLILDLRLDTQRNNGIRADYKAFSFAQEYRTRSTQGAVPDIPIILITTDHKFASLYLKDNTSHDLFDFYFIKEGIRDQLNIGDMLVDFVLGYKRLNEIKARGRKRLIDALACSSSELFDERCGSRYGHQRTFPAHDYASFIFKQLIQFPGLLIDENTLAARLGVDTSNSPDWQSLLKILGEECEYKGVFGYAWKRWWESLVEDWWKEKVKSKEFLQHLSAEKRVEILMKRFGLPHLNAAKPISEGYSTHYWTICEESRRPLDPLDGVVIGEPEEPQPWQSRRYISILAALENSKGSKFQPHVLEKERIKQLKASHG